MHTATLREPTLQRPRFPGPLPTLALTTLILGTTPALAERDGAFHARGQDAPPSCSLTASLALKACTNDTRDNYFLQLGKCQNVADAEARKDCRASAKATLRDERQVCGEQRDARLEICDALGEAAYDPLIQPEAFLSPQQTAANPNPWFPLVPGTTWVYRSGEETISVSVTENTREILGVAATEIHDIVTVDGELIEDTLDWYAQDLDGNVWYLGEIARNYEDGLLHDLDGSWTSGAELARPGIIMKAAPQVGDLYRQEFLLGEAEDMGEVLDTAGTATTPATHCAGTCVVTRDFTPLEPDATEHKYYAPGIGPILVVNPETGEREELVEFTRP